MIPGICLMIDDCNDHTETAIKAKGLYNYGKWDKGKDRSATTCIRVWVGIFYCIAISQTVGRWG